MNLSMDLYQENLLTLFISQISTFLGKTFLLIKLIMVNIILELDDYESLADMNEDGIVNILDVITLINTILER